LFDRGYVTIDERHRFAVSRRLREDFGNGRVYDKRHGQPIRLPQLQAHRPSAMALA